MKVIGIFGKKGGSGKTLVSHFIAQGMATGLGVDTIVLQTDVRTNRPDEIVQSRDYAMMSIRNENPESDLGFISKSYTKLDERGGNVLLIIDGGANRSALDLKLTPLCDLVLIPTQFSDEDTAVAEADYWAMIKAVMADHEKAKASGTQPFKDTQVMMLQNRWPGTVSKYNSITSKPRIADFLFRNNRIGAMFPKYIPDMQSLTEIATSNDPKHTPRINSQARAFAKIVAMSIGMEVQERPLPINMEPKAVLEIGANAA